MKIDEKFNKGITLISLIITVIILIILVGVSIGIATDGKLFDRAEKSANTVNSKVQQQEEQTGNIKQQWYGLDVPSEEEEQVTKVTCSICSGSGTITKTCNAVTEACETCGGSGICPGRMPANTENLDEGGTCEFCGGTFKCFDAQCRYCGTIYITCWDCADRGVQCKERCIDCQGIGEISMPCIHGQYSSHTYTETCEECSGTGKIVIE